MAGSRSLGSDGGVPCPASRPKMGRRARSHALRNKESPMRLTVLRSCGPRTEAGRRRASMNRCTHGMSSTKDLIEGESAEERQQLRDQIYQAVAPRDGVEELLAERIFDSAWHVRRGQRARNSKATKTVNALIEGGADRETRRVDALAAQVEERPEALRELRTFPLGVAYLWDQWSLIDGYLSQDTPLLASTRSLCFSLLGKKQEQVLRGDPVTTRWFIGLAGLMYGEEATLDNVLELLGTDPPEWMSDAEFVTRATRLQREVPAPAVAKERITGYVAEVMEELGGQWDYVNEVADRDIGLDTIVATLDTTPAGMSLASAIDKAEKSCLAAIRRLQTGRAPVRPGPKRGPKQTESAAEALRNLVEPGQAEPAGVAADAQATVAAEVPAGDPAPTSLTMTEAAEPLTEGDPGPAPSEPVDEKRANEPILERAPSEPVDEKRANEPILERAPSEPVDEKRANEPILERAPFEPVDEKRANEPILERAPEEPDFERFGPYAGSLKRLKLMLDANYPDVRTRAIRSAPGRRLRRGRLPGRMPARTGRPLRVGHSCRRCGEGKSACQGGGGVGDAGRRRSHASLTSTLGSTAIAPNLAGRPRFPTGSGPSRPRRGGHREEIFALPAEFGDSFPPFHDSDSGASMIPRSFSIRIATTAGGKPEQPRPPAEVRSLFASGSWRMVFFTHLAAPASSHGGPWPGR